MIDPRIIWLEFGSMKLVIIESPYAGEIDRNVAYARACMRDSLERGEAPIASHLLYTQPGILRDEDPAERQWGIDAGLAWRRVAEKAVFYTDRNWSGGMIAARKLYMDEGFPFEERSLASADTHPQGGDALAAPFMSGAVPPVEAGDAQRPSE